MPAAVPRRNGIVDRDHQTGFETNGHRVSNARNDEEELMNRCFPLPPTGVASRPDSPKMWFNTRSIAWQEQKLLVPRVEVGLVE